ncbi:MAG: transposase [Acidobacteriota bacterium]
MKVIRAAIKAAHKPTFRVCELNVLGNHAHLLTEALDAQALARGMQGLEVRLARRLNSALKRRGTLFAQRYHARILTTPREVRNCRRYVRLNRKHHAAEKKFARAWIDPCSSAAWFAGWAEPIRVNTGWKHALVTMEPPVARAETWLLAVGWRRHGPLAFDERPA